MADDATKPPGAPHPAEMALVPRSPGTLVPRPRGNITSEMSLAENVQRVPVPFGGGNQYVCPACEEVIPPLRTVFLAKPPKYAHLLNDIVRCCWCKFAFSPRSEALVMRG